VLGPGKRTLTMALPVQLKPGADAAASEPVSAPSGGGRALPDDLQARMGRSFGSDFSSVRVHEGDHATAMGALAYTQGTDIHFAPGQYQPTSQSGQQLIGHELAHVVQQSQGRVAATTQAKGVDMNDDSSLEHEADEAGARAARREPAGMSGGLTGNAIAGPMQRKVIQRNAEVPTHYGKFRILPAGSRMEPWGTCTIYGSYGMKLVDGPDTGKTGYVDQTLLQKES
jgi:hypothetical protein